MSKPPTILTLAWQGDLRFSTVAGSQTITIDGDGKAGWSPVQGLAISIAGCMAMDVVHVLTKGRHGLKGLRLDLKGQRAETEPRRFTSVEMHYSINGNVPEAAVQRAIDLSREKYCSVWHSMRQDIELKVTFSISAE